MSVIVIYRIHHYCSLKRDTEKCLQKENRDLQGFYKQNKKTVQGIY